MITTIPWTFIFVVLTYLLTLFPGWLSPFSNTIGYGVVLLGGIGSLMNNILQPNPKLVPNNPQTKIIQESLAHIYADKSLLINEITLENFDYFWQMMSGIFKAGVKDNLQLKNQLYNMVRLKTLVAEYVWYILTGVLVTSVSYNYLVNSGCSKSADEMKKRHDEYEEQMKNISNDDKRVYSTTE
jgi:HSP90 family molecular chaperone